jgi:hypothetical protein
MTTPVNLIYCRFSPRPEQAAERAVSLQVQIEACQKYCNANNLIVDDIISDPETSARLTPLFERPGGVRVKSLPPGSNVIAMKLDRVFRRTIDGLTTIETWKQQQVQLHLANEGGCSINTSTATGEMIATFLLGVASWEPRAIAERTRSAINHRLDNNLSHLNPANLPYGMMQDTSTDTHAVSGHHQGMCDCPDEQQVIEQVVILHENGWGLRAICRTLTENGILCRDKPWEPVKIKRIIKRHAKLND